MERARISALIASPQLRAVMSCFALLLTLALLRGNVLSESVHAVVADVANPGLNAADMESQTRNYYREVSNVNVGYFAGLRGFLTQLGLRKPGPNLDAGLVPIKQTDLVHQPDPFLPYEFKPSYEIIHRYGLPIRTNQWGMRDCEYALEPGPDTFRMALVGASNSMGYGVQVEEGYVELLEDRLNAELAAKHFAHYEVLNFSVGGYDLTDRLYVAATRIPQFKPDVIFVIVLGRDLEFHVQDRIAERLSSGGPAHFDFIKQIISEAGIEPDDSYLKLKQRLRPYRAPLIRGCAEEMQKLAARTGVPVFAVVLNLAAQPTYQLLIDTAQLCESAGTPTLRLFKAYDGYAGEQVYLSSNDPHPSPLGHQLIANEFYSIIFEHSTLGPMIRREVARKAPGDSTENAE